MCIHFSYLLYHRNLCPWPLELRQNAHFRLFRKFRAKFVCKKWRRKTWNYKKISFFATTQITVSWDKKRKIRLRYKFSKTKNNTVQDWASCEISNNEMFSSHLHSTGHMNVFGRSQMSLKWPVISSFMASQNRTN